MIDIYNIKLLDLLPINFRNDPDMIAAAKSVDNDFSLVVNEAKQCILLPRIDELEDNVLDELAWQMHVDFYDTTLSTKAKRELIKESNNLHKKKGTSFAVEKAAKIVFGRSWVEEWYQYGGNNYFFKISIEITNRGASKRDLFLLEKLINAYKNRRSWLEVINIFLTCDSKFYIASTISTGESITVYPWMKREIQSIGEINIAVGSNFGLENITIYPKKG